MARPAAELEPVGTTESLQKPAYMGRLTPGPKRRGAIHRTGSVPGGVLKQACRDREGKWGRAVGPVSSGRSDSRILLKGEGAV